MKKRIILSILLGIFIVGGTASFVALHNKNWYQNIKEKFVTSGELEASKNIDREVKIKNEAKTEEKIEDSKEKMQDEEVKKGDNKEEASLEDYKKVSNSKTDEKKVEGNKEAQKTSENNQQVSKQTNSKPQSKPKESGQSLEEGYELSYQARDAYDRGDVDEAVRIYSKITNKAALAKTVDEKRLYDFSKGVDSDIANCEALYNSGQYAKARINAREIMQGNRLTKKQEYRINKIISDSLKKDNNLGEKEMNKNFTPEKAKELLRKHTNKPNQKYHIDSEYIDINGVKTYAVTEILGNDKYGVMYNVNANGKVWESC